MSYLQILRACVDHQQFDSLQQQAEAYWQETADIDALPLIALAHGHRHERQQALDWLSRAETYLSQYDEDAQIDVAGVHCLLMQIKRAEQILQPVLQAHPRHALALARLAWCKMQQGELDQARQYYQESACLKPERLPVWCALTRLHLQKKDFEQAQQALDQAIARFEQNQPHLPEAAAGLFIEQLRTLQLEIWGGSQQRETAEQWLNQKREQLDEASWVQLVVNYAAVLAGYDAVTEAESVLRDALQGYPDNLALLSQLAELAQVQGRHWQTVKVLRRMIRLAERDHEPSVMYWVRLSAACLHQQPETAREAADQAVTQAEQLVESDALSGDQIQMMMLQAQHALAQVDMQQQQFELSEQRFNQILDIDPWFVPALQGLGQQRMQQGQIEQAVALFDKVKQVDPAKGYSALISARHFPEDEQTLQQLERVARMPSLEGSTRSGLLFQLASAWEKRKAYDKAFMLADEANQASKKWLHYQPEAHRQYCAEIRYAFCRDFYQHRAGYGREQQLPLFVVGMPRSGTTLVEQILSGHSQICGAGELGVIPQVIAGLNRWERHTGSGRKFPECMDDLTQEVTQHLADNILKELKEYDDQAHYVVDKLPHNFENIGLIKFLFPQAKIISVRRDPRDIAISNYFTDFQAKHGGMGFAYDLTWIGEQLADHNLLMHHWHQLFPEQILEIQYEHLVDNTEGVARQMLSYLQLPWESQVLAFNQLERTVKTASIWQVRQPIYQSAKQKWRRYESRLAPLIRGTNAKIRPQPVEMVTLPEPGLLTSGVAFYRNKQLDEAERQFKKLLHFLPEHASANFMLGIVYAQKGHLNDAVDLMEKGYQQCPWNQNWRNDLQQACQMAGQPDRTQSLSSSTESDERQASGSVEAVR